MADIRWDTLKVPVSGWLAFKTSVRMAFQKLVHKVPLISKGLRFIGYRLVFLGNLRQEESGRLASINLLRNDRRDAQKFGSAYGYADEVAELMVAYKYWNQLQKKDFDSMPAESGVLYEETVQRVSGLFKTDPGIKTFFNFGVCYAHVDSILAQKHPDIQFLGIDRSKYTKLFNEDNFSQIKNMEFVTGDIFDYLKGKKFPDGVFFTARTLVYLPMNFIQRLLKCVRDAEFRYIVGFEQVGISRETLKPYEFSLEVTPSVLFRNNFFIHNYPALVSQAGYDLQSVELIKTKHPHEDYRFMNFVAQLKQGHNLNETRAEADVYAQKVS